MTYSQEEIRKIVECSMETTVAEAASRYSVSCTSIYNWRSELGHIPRVSTVRREKLEKLLIDLVDENPYISVRDAAAILGLNSQTVRKMARRLGVKMNSTKIRRDDVERVKEFFDGRSSFTFANACDELGMKYSKLKQIMEMLNIECEKINSGKGASRLDENSVREYIKAHPNATLRELGTVFDISRQGILNFINTHDVPYRSKSRGESETVLNRISSETSRVKEVFDAGDWASFTDVSRRANVGISRVERYAKENGIRARLPRPSVSQPVLKDAVERFPTYKDAAEFLGVSRTTVGRLVCHYGLQKRKRKASGLEKE